MPTPTPTPLVVRLTEDPSQVTASAEVVYRGPSEREARRAAARAIGAGSLRGLAQVPTEAGTRYYAPGANDHRGASVEIAL